MNLATGLVVTRQRVWNIPITPTVIKAVETMAAEQGIKSLKLEGRNKIPLLNIRDIMRYFGEFVSGNPSGKVLFADLVSPDI